MLYTITFTEQEIHLLSDGLLRLIRDAGEAERLLAGSSEEVFEAIKARTKTLQALNSKICNAR